MASERWAFAFPAQVVERAPVDAQELGSFSDCEEGVGIIGHEDLLNCGLVSVRHLDAGLE
jgi:hypothetical protein